ncbi:MAG: hypothetical protein H0T89_18725 [Deltaproteobacteria bacterium]|nr:hypothetical protein [Deltaproteobacteria bacterium]MDQ3301629.1 hypothetical protein [Myxococcota bacterium]
MRTCLFLLVASMLSVGPFVAPALADPAPTPDVKKMASDDCARARKLNKTCVLSIEDEQIDGTSPTAGEPPISVTTHINHASLIRIRYDFIAEILKSAEDL